MIPQKPQKPDTIAALVNYLIKLKGIDESKTVETFNIIIDALDGVHIKDDMEIDSKDELFNKECKDHQSFAVMYKKRVALNSFATAVVVNPSIIKYLIIDLNHPYHTLKLSFLSSCAPSMIELIRLVPELIKHAHRSLTTNKNFLCEAALANPLVLRHNPELFKNKEVIMSIIIANPELATCLIGRYKNDKEFMLEVVVIHPHLVKFASLEVQHDNKFLKKALTANARIIEFLNIDLQHNYYVCCIAAKTDVSYLRFLSNEVKNTLPLMIYVANTIGGAAFNYAGDEILDDCGSVSKAIKLVGRVVFDNLPIKYKTKAKLDKLECYGVELTKADYVNCESNYVNVKK